MKIRVERDVLADAVAWVARSLPNRPSVPILAGLRLDASGDQVAKGQKLGDIHDPQGQQFHPVLAPRAGYIIGHNNAAVVSSGDALFHLGWT